MYMYNKYKGSLTVAMNMLGGIRHIHEMPAF